MKQRCLSSSRSHGCQLWLWTLAVELWLCAVWAILVKSGCAVWVMAVSYGCGLSL